MKRSYSYAFKDEDTPDTIIDDEFLDNESVDSETQGLIDTISEYISEGDWTTANELIDENSININSIASSGDGFLHTAIINGHLDIIRVLLELEANPNSLNEEGQRPLSLAISHDIGKVKAIMNELLKHDANPNLANDDGSFPIHLALEQAGLEILQLLVGFNSLGLSAKRIIGGKDLLHHLIKLNLPDGPLIAQFLISNGDLDVNAVNRFGATPLHEAARIGNIDMIRELLRYMPDITIQDGDGNTALDVAKDEVKVILEEYSRLEGQNLASFVYDGVTVLPAGDVAAIERGYDEDEWRVPLSKGCMNSPLVGDIGFEALDPLFVASLFS